MRKKIWMCAYKLLFFRHCFHIGIAHFVYFAQFLNDTLIDPNSVVTQFAYLVDRVGDEEECRAATHHFVHAL